MKKWWILYSALMVILVIMFVTFFDIIKVYYNNLNEDKLLIWAHGQTINSPDRIFGIPLAVPLPIFAGIILGSMFGYIRMVPESTFFPFEWIVFFWCFWFIITMAIAARSYDNLIPDSTGIPCAILFSIVFWMSFLAWRIKAVGKNLKGGE